VSDPARQVSSLKDPNSGVSAAGLTGDLNKPTVAPIGQATLAVSIPPSAAVANRYVLGEKIAQGVSVLFFARRTPFWAAKWQ
jgi:hypothetical protein